MYMYVLMLVSNYSELSDSELFVAEITDLFYPQAIYMYLYSLVLCYTNALVNEVLISILRSYWRTMPSLELLSLEQTATHQMEVNLDYSLCNSEDKR